MTQPLFHSKQTVFEKAAAETALPEDPNTWPDDILQEAYKQVPYLADFDLQVEMSAVDGERGYGLGHIEVVSKTEAPMTAPAEQLKAAGIRKSRIPIIVKDSKLLPLDVVVTDDSKVLPLTEARLRQAMFRPQNFDVTSKTPGDQSMIGQLYPPFRQSNGFGGGGVAISADMGGKTAAANGVLAAVLSQASQADLLDFRDTLRDDQVKVAFVQNVATHSALQAVAAADPLTTTKIASVVQAHLQMSAVQVSLNSDGTYAVKTASRHAWAPATRVLDRGALVREFGVKVALAADTSGSVVAAPDAPAQEEPQAQPTAPLAAAGPISSPGTYLVQTSSGEPLTGVVIPNLLDADGTALPISLFTDGQHAAVQADLSGSPVGEFQAPGVLPANQAAGYGVFIQVVGGIPQATVPLRLGAVVHAVPGMDDAVHVAAETFDGRAVNVSVQDYVATVVGVDDHMIVPSSWGWLPLDTAESVDLAETPGEVAKLASAGSRGQAVVIRAGGLDCFSLEGTPVEKLAEDDRNFLRQSDTLFVLAGCGLSPAAAQTKLAQVLATPGRQLVVQVPCAIKTAHEVIGECTLRAEEFLSSAAPVVRHRMWKEAAVIPDPVAVDSVLSLGFLNPENISSFVGYLPTFDEAQRRLCELLLGARLGLREVPEGALERAVRALEDVIEGLKVIAFQG